MLRAVRGATTVDVDAPDLIAAATREMLQELQRRNDIDADDLVSALFTVTPDLRTTFPALAARQLGWLDVPLLCATEIDVLDSLPRCIRVLVHFHTTRSRSMIQHVYLGGARVLRPDLAYD